MKISASLMALTLMASLAALPAAAFTRDTASAQNTDGTPKFADPDDQMPGIMTVPSGAGTSSLSLSGSSSPAANIPHPGDNDHGTQAFDQAFARQQDR